MCHTQLSSLTFAQNWFQNRRAKVKHEEKKHRNSIPSWSADITNGIPLSDHSFINSALQQVQGGSDAPDFPSFHHSTLASEILNPYNPSTTIGDCPTIQEEPTMPTDPMMNFLGIENGSQVHLRDVNQISRQFNPHTGQPETFGSTSNNGPSSHQFPTRHPIIGHYHQNVVSGGFALPHSGSVTHSATPELDLNDSSVSSVQGHGGAPDASFFAPDYSLHQPQQSETQLDLDEAKSIMHQLRVQTSQESHHFHEQNFGYPNAQTHLANPQPVALSHTPVEDSHSPGSQDPLSQSVQTNDDFQSAMEELHAPSRTDSGTSALADNVGEINIAPSQAVPMRPPSTCSQSFAQRRQKRPANISASAPRSYSSSHAPLSASDRNVHSSAPKEPHLRRIKSSSVVLGGRVTKSGQRSPLHQWSSTEGNHHLSRQLSTSSLNAALKGEEQSTHASHSRSMSTHQATTHVHHPSNGSMFSHLTIPEDSSPPDQSVWSQMSTTVETPISSIYQSAPQTAHTLKSYTSSPQSPMDHTQMASMQIQHPGFAHPSAGHHPYQSLIGSSQLSAHGSMVPNDVAQHVAHQIHPQNVSQEPPMMSTEELLMHTIPANPSNHTTAVHEQPQAHAHEQGHMAQSMHSTLPILNGNNNYTADQHHSLLTPYVSAPAAQPAPLPSPAQPIDFQNHPQQNQYIWNIQQQIDQHHPDASQAQDLQIHHFTPSNPVDPSNLPPKHKQASPRQNYSFQNFGPDHYSSPKSQSSQSKGSSPGHVHLISPTNQGLQ